MDEGAVVANVLAFIRGLRHLGFSAGPDRVALALRALRAVGFRGWPDDVRDALRTVLASTRDQEALFDTAWEQFALLLSGSGSHPLAGQTLLAHVARLRFARRRPPQVIWAGAASGDAGDGKPPEADKQVPLVVTGGGASPNPALRHKDFAALTEAERQEMERWTAAARWPLWRRSRRWRRHRAGTVWDVPATLRRQLASGGEIVRLERRRRRLALRPVVMLCDVSGSMEPYSRMVLRFAKSLIRSGWPLDVYAFSTSLVRLTPALRDDYADRALEHAIGLIPDFAGGTRVADCLGTFNRRWARIALRRRAAAVIVSDGLDAGDPDAAAAEMARLARLAWAVVWLNPGLGRPGYEPTARGMAAALPYLNAFWPGHTWASLEEAWERLARIDPLFKPYASRVGAGSG